MEFTRKLKGFHGIQGEVNSFFWGFQNMMPNGTEWDVELDFKLDFIELSRIYNQHCSNQHNDLWDYLGVSEVI